MKIQHYAIIFIIIILPFSIVCKSRINNKIDVLNNETRINNALDTATMDAIDTLIDLNGEYYALYEGQTLDVTPTIAKEGIKVFFQSLALNDSLPFVADEKFAENYFSPYIPAIIVVAYDGFYVYSIEKTASNTYEYVLSPKIPYAYEENGYFINFSLGNYIKLYTPKGEIFEGEFKYDYINNSKVIAEYSEIYGILESRTIESLPQLTTDMSLIAYALEQNGRGLPSFLTTKTGVSMLNDYDVYDDVVSDFHQKRRETIINLIIDTLNEKMNNHNRYGDMMGITYDFYLPEIDNADWINSVDDVSIMAFVQGIPTGHETYYNSYALGASRIIRTDYIYGMTDGLYHYSTCLDVVDKIDVDGYPVNEEITDMFLNEVDAACAGYFPCMRDKSGWRSDIVIEDEVVSGGTTGTENSGTTGSSSGTEGSGASNTSGGTGGSGTSSGNIGNTGTSNTPTATPTPIKTPTQTKTPTPTPSPTPVEEDDDDNWWNNFWNSLWNSIFG